MRWGELTCVFFFKQKTAYEMRISDWSSDGCSSDLHERGEQLAAVVVRERHERPHQQELQLLRVGQAGEQVVRVDPGLAGRDDVAGGISRLGALRSAGGAGIARSEEHTSELQSLMRISYAVFCLNKTKIKMSAERATE